MTYRTLLEEAAAKAQAAWDARHAQLDGLHVQLQATFAQVDEPVPEAFAAVGDALTAGRVAQYEVRASACRRGRRSSSWVYGHAHGVEALCCGSRCSYL